MGSQRAGHGWATELNWTDKCITNKTDWHCAFIISFSCWIIQERGQVGKFVCSSMIPIKAACISLGKESIEHLELCHPWPWSLYCVVSKFPRKTPFRNRAWVFKTTFPRSTVRSMKTNQDLESKGEFKSRFFKCLDIWSPDLGQDTSHFVSTYSPASCPSHSVIVRHKQANQNQDLIKIREERMWYTLPCINQTHHFAPNITMSDNKVHDLNM